MTSHDVRNPKVLTDEARGDSLGIANGHEGKSKDGLDQHIEGDRDEGGLVSVKRKRTSESAPGQMSERRVNNDKVERGVVR